MQLHILRLNFSREQGLKREWGRCGLPNVAGLQIPSFPAVHHAGRADTNWRPQGPQPWTKRMGKKQILRRGFLKREREVVPLQTFWKGALAIMGRKNEQGC